jgi:hypothetical protein
MMADCMNADMESACDLAVGKSEGGERNNLNLPFREMLGVTAATRPSRHP